MEKKTTTPFKFKLGADPEFAFMYNSKKIHAQALLTKMRSCSEQGIKVGNAGYLGWDGHNPTAEIRPNPANTPIELVNNIGELLKEVPKFSRVIEMTTNSLQGDPLGGHIHFEIPENISDNEVRNIHKIMCIFYMPVMLGEDLLNKQMRQRRNYGRLNDLRTQGTGKTWPSGKQISTYEFRTPNAEWICSPEVAYATLAYLGTVYNEIIYNRKNVMKNSQIISMNQAHIDSLEQLALAQYKFLTNEMVNSIRKQIKTFEFYEQYKEEIDFVLSPNKVLKEKQKINFEISRGWDIAPNEKIEKKELLKEKTLSDSDKDRLTRLSTFIKVSYNPSDMKTKKFAKAMRETILINSWKLKNEYFIFGIAGDKKSYVVADQDRNLYEGGKLLKTEKDRETMNKMIQKMIRKYFETTTEIVENDQQKLYIIGVPLKDRIEDRTDKLIKKIYNIENRKPKGIPIAEIELVTDKKGKDNEDLKETLKQTEKAEKVLNGQF